MEGLRAAGLHLKAGIKGLSSW